MRKLTRRSFFQVGQQCLHSCCQYQESRSQRGVNDFISAGSYIAHHDRIHCGCLPVRLMWVWGLHGRVRQEWYVQCRSSKKDIADADECLVDAFAEAKCATLILVSNFGKTTNDIWLDLSDTASEKKSCNNICVISHRRYARIQMTRVGKTHILNDIGLPGGNACIFRGAEDMCWHSLFFLMWSMDEIKVRWFSNTLCGVGTSLP